MYSIIVRLSLKKFQPKGQVQYVDNGSTRTCPVYNIFILIIGTLRLLHGIQFTLLSDLLTDPPTFSLSIVSTGGPVDTVVWTKDGNTSIPGSNQSVSESYLCTLTITGRTTGIYQISIINSKSHISKSFNLTGMF